MFKPVLFFNYNGVVDESNFWSDCEDFSLKCSHDGNWYTFGEASDLPCYGNIFTVFGV